MRSRRQAITISETDSSCLPEYARIPIAFEVTEIFEPATLMPGVDITGSTARPTASPYTKNYDAYASSGPLHWASSFDVTRWRFLMAYVGKDVAGGAVVVAQQDSIAMLEARCDLAVLWDLRVVPEFRRSGVGTALLSGVERVARMDGAAELKVETQNINVAACRFYSRHGLTLRKVSPEAYPGLPGEARLLWYKAL
ncbi:MAG: GNAT family N-acetyltransferase [Gemmatimonadaceae bacterium]